MSSKQSHRSPKATHPEGSTDEIGRRTDDVTEDCESEEGV